MDLMEFNLAGNDVVAVSATSAQSAAMPYNKLHLVSTTDCWVIFGSDPTAQVGTDGNIFLKAGEQMIIKFNSGWKIAAIRSSADGYICVTPLSF